MRIVGCGGKSSGLFIFRFQCFNRFLTMQKKKDQNHLMVIGDVAQWVEHSVHLISVTPASRTQEDEDSRSSLAT